MWQTYWSAVSDMPQYTGSAASVEGFSDGGPYPVVFAAGAESGQELV
jgi:hypothetical protein